MPASGKQAIQLYRSVTAGTRPPSLAQGELFINEEDSVLCWPDTDGTVRTTWLSSAQGVPKVITTTTYTVVNVDQWLVFNSASTCTVTLPTANAANAGRTLFVKNIAAISVVSATAASVKPIGSNTAGTAILSATAGKWATLVCDGMNWVIMQAN